MTSSPVNPLPPTGTGKLERRRAPHTKSRAGCISCKEKRVKCDQIRPACTRCQRSHAQCRYHPPKSPSQQLFFRGFRPSRLSSERQPAHVITADSASLRRSVEYFCIRVLPILRSSHPSGLWDHLVMRLLHPRTSLCHIVAAIGAQQRMTNEQKSYASPVASLQARDLYTRAVSSLRASITASADDHVDAHILPCLLMAVLESLRGSHSNLLMHLRCGLRIMCEQTSILSDDARDAARILQHHAAQLTLFNPLSADAQSLRAMLAELLVRGGAQVEAAFDPISTLSSSSIELISLMTDHYRESPCPATAPPELSGKLPTRLEIPLRRLEKRRQLIELAIDARLFSAESFNDVQTAVFNLAKSWCLLMKVFLTSGWTGRQTTYDDELESFRRIVDCAATTVGLMTSGNSGDCDGVVTNSTNFTVGFSVQATLLMVMHQCRDTATRQRVLRLLDQCPQHEGLCDTALVKALCHVISTFEEQNATGSGISIPEDHRIHHYLILPTEKEDGASPIARLYYRPVGRTGFAFHDRILC